MSNKQLIENSFFPSKYNIWKRNWVIFKETNFWNRKWSEPFFHFIEISFHSKHFQLLPFWVISVKDETKAKAKTNTESNGLTKSFRWKIIQFSFHSEFKLSNFVFVSSKCNSFWKYQFNQPEWMAIYWTKKLYFLNWFRVSHTFARVFPLIFAKGIVNFLDFSHLI